jgi:hypothetical protein
MVMLIHEAKQLPPDLTPFKPSSQPHCSGPQTSKAPISLLPILGFASKCFYTNLFGSAIEKICFGKRVRREERARSASKPWKILARRGGAELNAFDRKKRQ